jgi:hypothetical protein
MSRKLSESPDAYFGACTISKVVAIEGLRLQARLDFMAASWGSISQYS